MKGKISFSIQNRHITFKFDLERNITIITGDSGTGKTKLINMVRMYSEQGKSSGITLKCEKPCISRVKNSSVGSAFLQTSLLKRPEESRNCNIQRIKASCLPVI